MEDLATARKAVEPWGLPLLRKDFTLEPYHLYEARTWGADAVLLIVAALPSRDLRGLLEEAKALRLQCLVELHTEQELQKALEAGAEVVGINNRDLHTFTTDLSVTERLSPLVPRGKVIVSESGLFSRADVLRMRRAGAHAVLVGEALVTAPNPGAKLRELLGR